MRSLQERYALIQPEPDDQHQLNDDWQLSSLWSDGEKERYNFLKQRPYSRSLSVITVKYTTTSIMKDIFKTDRLISKNAVPLSLSGFKSALHRFV